MSKSDISDPCKGNLTLEGLNVGKCDITVFGHVDSIWLACNYDHWPGVQLISIKEVNDNKQVKNVKTFSEEF